MGLTVVDVTRIRMLMYSLARAGTRNNARDSSAVTQPC